MTARRRGQAADRAGRAVLPDLPHRQRLERPHRRPPVAANSATMIASIGLDRGLHMDFGSYAGYGIPYQVVTAATPRSTVTFDYATSPTTSAIRSRRRPKIEGGSDRHILMVDKDACRLYELFAASQVGRPLARRERRDLGPALERAAAGRLDERRRRRPADPARARPLRRGRGRRDPPRAAVHDEPDAQGRTSTRPATTPATRPRRRCRRWACASGSRRRSTRRGFSPAGPGHRRGPQALRDDPRRQRLALVHQRRERPALRRRRHARARRHHRPRPRGRRHDRAGQRARPTRRARGGAAHHSA